MERHGGGRVLNTLRLVGSGLLDLIYPPFCLVCERQGRPALCEECAASFVDIPEPVCRICGHPSEEGIGCSLCAAATHHNGWGFDAARASSVYQGPLRHAIHLLKYRHREMLGEPLGTYLANRIAVDGLLGVPVDAVVPVPVHPARQRDRGFNQSALLAAPVAAMLGVPLVNDAVRKARKTTAQVGLSPAARRKNLHGAFTATPEAVAGKRILLVDDVLTTGATVSACAAALKEAGADAVHVVVLASGG